MKRGDTSNKFFYLERIQIHHFEYCHYAHFWYTCLLRQVYLTRLTAVIGDSYYTIKIRISTRITKKNTKQQQEAGK